MYPGTDGSLSRVVCEPLYELLLATGDSAGDVNYIVEMMCHANRMTGLNI